MNIIGTMLKEFRKRNKITQEDLAFGLCAVSNLSRRENGGQIPSRKLAEGLFSRVGAPLPPFAQMKNSNINFIAAFMMRSTGRALKT